LLDQPDKEYDKRISTFLLKQATINSAGRKEVSSSSGTPAGIKNSEIIWDIDMIRQYIAYVRERFHPILSPEAAALVQRYSV